MAVSRSVLLQWWCQDLSACFAEVGEAVSDSETNAFNFVGVFTDNSWNTEGAIMRLIATDVVPAVI
jgi:hypothetical protein